eukprot:1261278-Rhodomonas_salina.1
MRLGNHQLTVRGHGRGGDCLVTLETDAEEESEEEESEEEEEEMRACEACGTREHDGGSKQTEDCC